MQQKDLMNISFTLLLPYLSTVIVSILGYYFLLTSFNRKIKIFHVTAQKSTSNAILMGGVPLLLGISSGILLLEKSSLVFAWLTSSLIIAVGGWIDDQWEIRARVKLFFQATGSLIFAYQAAQELHFFWPSFLVISFLSMALLNGTNLLDGLDTMLIKLKTVSFLAFLWCAYKFNSPLLASLSVIGIMALLSFFPFNRYPSKIHQGEIGSSYLGFFALLLGVICIRAGKDLEATSLSCTLIALSLPIIELSISFSRRILTQKSPFRGDRLHLHHILKNKFHWSALKTTSLMALILGSIITCSFIMVTLIHPALVLFCHFALNYTLYTKICYKEWLAANSKKNFSQLFLSIDQGKIDFVDVKNLDAIDYDLSDLTKSKIAS